MHQSKHTQRQPLSAAAPLCAVTISVKLSLNARYTHTNTLLVAALRGMSALSLSLSFGELGVLDTALRRTEEEEG